MNAEQPGLVIVRGVTDGFVQEIIAVPHPLRSDEPTAVGGTKPGCAQRPSSRCAGLVHVDDHGDVCATKEVAAGACHRSPTPFPRPCRGCADCETQDARLTVIDREIALEGSLDEDQRARLLAIANRCPVHLTLSSRIDIRTKLQ